MRKSLDRLLRISIALIAVSTARAFAEEMVTVTITATLPKDTPADASIYIAGNLDQLGKWKADGVAMKKLDSGEYQVDLKLPKGETLEYKITRGSWETVEKGASGEELENRKLALDGDKTEKITVAGWAKKSGAAPQSGEMGDSRFHDHFATEAVG